MAAGPVTNVSSPPPACRPRRAPLHYVIIPNAAAAPPGICQRRTLPLCFSYLKYLPTFIEVLLTTNQLCGIRIQRSSIITRNSIKYVCGIVRNLEPSLRTIWDSRVETVKHVARCQRARASAPAGIPNAPRSRRVVDRTSAFN